MITTPSKNNSLICVEDLCEDRLVGCLEGNSHTEQRLQSLQKSLRELWYNIRLFLGTDRWDRAITLQRGDSHYTMKMEDIEARWRNR